MNKAALIIGGGAVGAALWWAGQQNRGNAPGAESVADILSGALTDAVTLVESVAQGGYLNISRMKGLSRSLLDNKNVQAMLRTIRVGEGTSDAGGYSRLYGGKSFNSFADHPRIAVTAGRWTSTAAGAYQFLSKTWDETARLMNLSDFSPANQDFAAVGRIAARGALDDVIAGRFAVAVEKLNKEWASLPGSPYGQPTLTWQVAENHYKNAGGALA